MAAKPPFKQVHATIQRFMERTNSMPVVKFDVGTTIPVELKDREFIFNAAEGQNASKQSVLGIMVAEQVGTQQVPFFTAHALKKKRDMNMTVIFSGEKKLSDELVDILLLAAKSAVDSHPHEETKTVH